jgi:hypothetical protein
VSSSGALSKEAEVTYLECLGIPIPRIPVLVLGLKEAYHSLVHF